jgi:hypothetical protein
VGIDWTSHGERVDGAEDIWVAVLGPDTPHLGEIRGGKAIKQGQVAATIAALLGLEADFVRFSPASAPSIREVVR